MRRKIFITGSTDGLGLAAARSLMAEGHAVVLHARSRERAASIDDSARGAVAVVTGDLSSIAETRKLADQVNDIGRMDAVIHNAGVYPSDEKPRSPEGHVATLAVNVLAPYLLTSLLERPDRLVFLSSSMHVGAVPPLDDLDWRSRRWSAGQAYSESKLCVTALALAVARLWPNVLSNAVDPGWVATKMGGAHAPDNLALGHVTQAWLAASDDAAARVSGRYWRHQRTEQSSPEARDVALQERLLLTLASLTAVYLPSA